MNTVYEIRTVKDFLTIPVEKRKSALDDFGLWLGMNDAIAELCAGGLLKVGDSFKWIDDGKIGCSEVNIKLSFDGEREAGES